VGKRDDKTEKPTAKRRREARREGQVAKSPEVATWLTVLVATFLLPWFGGRLLVLVDVAFAQIRSVAAEPTPELISAALATTLRHAFGLLLPVVIAMAALVVVADVAQMGRFVWASKAVKPQAKRLNPAQGVKRLVSSRNLWELGKQIVKLVVIVAVSVPVLVAFVRNLAGSNGLALLPLVRETGAQALALVRTVAAVALLVALADYGYQKRRNLKDMMMSKQEVKDESRLADGNPEIKGRIRSLQLSAARSRMMANVADASVVVVNPVHLAIALRYDPARGAPRVTAKGRGEAAERIRERAGEHGVPIVESIPLARALFAACEVDEEIPFALYEAVARLLAFVHRLGRRSGLTAQASLPETLLPPSLLPADLVAAGAAAARGESRPRRGHRAADAPARPTVSASG
jgi:flagellar biosynthetic protein FlhB